MCIACVLKRRTKGIGHKLTNIYLNFGLDGDSLNRHLAVGRRLGRGQRGQRGQDDEADLEQHVQTLNPRLNECRTTLRSVTRASMIQLLFEQIRTIEILHSTRTSMFVLVRQTFLAKKTSKKSADLHPRQGNLLQRNIITGLNKVSPYSTK
jgi:hypothetical protein